MNENYLISLAPVAGALLIAAVFIGTSAYHRGLRLKRLAAASDEMRNTLRSLQSEMVEIKESPRSQTTTEPPAIAGPTPLVSADQRAGAFEMFRNGADAGDVSASLGIAMPEATLLQKVEKLRPSAPAFS